jgi:hypothetical protein
MPFPLCAGQEMYVLRLFLVEAEAAWKKWRRAAQVGLSIERTAVAVVEQMRR